MARRRWFCHRSPTDSLLIHFGRWLDGAIVSMPNRYEGSLPLGSSAGELWAATGKFESVTGFLCCVQAISGSFSESACVLYTVLLTTNWAAAAAGLSYNHTGSRKSSAKLKLCILELQ